MSTEPDTEELKKLQIKRLADERELAREALDEEEHAQHERRAERASYLAGKLQEREESERQADERS